MRINAGQVNLNLVEQGEGEPALVFLHYWGGSVRTWARVTSLLGGSYRCIAYDQRGWGTSDQPESGYELADLAGDLTGLLARLGLRSYVLVGHSMGGKVAMLAASQRPMGLEALVLVAPASPLPQDLPEEAAEAQRHAYDNAETAGKAIDLLTFQAPSDAVREQLVQDSLRGSPGAKYAWPHSAAYQDISAAVRNISVPTLVLVGDHDRQDPVKQQREELMPLLQKAKLVTLPNCGHLAPVEQPDLLADAIAGWLATPDEYRSVGNLVIGDHSQPTSPLSLNPDHARLPTS
jgi:pimeloyl-ACP methyl ester carboxylesterase